MDHPAEADTLVLRPWAAGDLPAVERIVAASRTEFQTWLPTLEAELADFVGFLAGGERSAAARTGWYYCVQVDGDVVGQCSIEARPERTAEVGYWITSDRTNEGLATRAVLAMQRLAAGLGFERLLIRCDAGNLPSRGLPVKLASRT